MTNQEYVEIIKNTLTIEAASIQNLTKTLSEEKVLKVMQAIGDCKGRVIVSGCGTSGVAAKKLVHTLTCVERPALYLNPTDAVHGALGVIQKGDVFILISKGGNSQELLNLIPACKKKGATLIGVTENDESVIAKQADILLRIKVEKEPCPFNMLATASTIAVMSVFDAIAIALMFYTNYTREQFLLIHPGGAVGEKLLAKQ
jgi:KpsF/GutQ family protein